MDNGSILEPLGDVPNPKALHQLEREEHQWSLCRARASSSPNQLMLEAIGGGEGLGLTVCDHAGLTMTMIPEKLRTRPLDSGVRLNLSMLTTVNILCSTPMGMPISVRRTTTYSTAGMCRRERMARKLTTPPPPVQRTGQQLHRSTFTAFRIKSVLKLTMYFGVLGINYCPAPMFG